MKRKIEVFDYAGEVMKRLAKGVLLTTKANGKVNTMSISWGALGIEWNKPIFTTYVREGRFTRELLDANGEFTVNVPVDGSDLSLIGKCGSVSGRDTDKIAANNLTLVDGEKVSVPAIKEYPLTLECRIVYKQLQDKNAISEADKARFYPDLPSTNSGGNRDYHIAYFGEIVAAYIVE
ncbi:MAG: flavin reductase family protein [Kiritimatiellae bacterium]|nr:flavin reductase family protein [Kiritimatiellia bacterium]